MGDLFGVALASNHAGRPEDTGEHPIVDRGSRAVSGEMVVAIGLLGAIVIVDRLSVEVTVQGRAAEATVLRAIVRAVPRTVLEMPVAQVAEKAVDPGAAERHKGGPSDATTRGGTPSVGIGLIVEVRLGPDPAGRGLTGLAAPGLNDVHRVARKRARPVRGVVHVTMVAHVVTPVDPVATTGDRRVGLIRVVSAREGSGRMTAVLVRMVRRVPSTIEATVGHRGVGRPAVVRRPLMRSATPCSGIEDLERSPATRAPRTAGRVNQCAAQIDSSIANAR